MSELAFYIKELKAEVQKLVAATQALITDRDHYKDGYARLDGMLGPRHTGDDRSLFERLTAILQPEGECICRDEGCQHGARYHKTEADSRCIIPDCQCQGWL